MKPKSAKRTVRASAKATRKFLAPLGGRTTPASGAWLEKGDGRVHGRFRVETKCPPTGKYRITFLDWNKIWTVAVKANEIAVFHLSLAGQEIVILREVDYRGLGGEENNIGDLDRQGSHEFDVHTWIGLRLLHPHWRMILTYGGKHVQLRLLPHHDFYELAKRSA